MLSPLANRNKVANMTKQCFKCKKTLPLTMFYKHPKMPDGRVNKCKECGKKDVRENRLKKVGYYREYDKERSSLPKRVEARNDYSKTEQGKSAHQKARSKWTESNQIKRIASTIVGNAVRDERLLKPKVCSECGGSNKRLEGHHDDYAYPMSVRWLCSKCHRAWHKANREGLNC